MVTSPTAQNRDFHWYRQNPDGTWSHKPGGTNVINVDASGNLIFDPEIADRNYAYANYESDNYGLILWDHGGGPICI